MTICPPRVPPLRPLYSLKLDTFLKGQELPNIEGLPVEELKDKVLQLPNVELSVHSDWNDDLQASISKGKKCEFQDAIKKNDFTRIAGLKDEGYIPSRLVERFEGAITLILDTVTFSKSYYVVKIRLR